MSNSFCKIGDDLKKLIKQSDLLHLGLLLELKKISDSDLEKFNGVQIPKFTSDYEVWYSEACAVIKILLPDRLLDFKCLYRNEKRKSINYLTYTIADYLLRVSVSKGSTSIVDGNAALPKYVQQTHILSAAARRLESTLFDITTIVQADLFDDELDAADMLNRQGFHRAAGAIAGVVLEGHLKKVCLSYKMQRKKRANISDYNDALKEKEVISVPTWRFIQHLGDLRNICDHPKDVEPSLAVVSDLIQGVRKITKSVF